MTLRLRTLFTLITLVSGLAGCKPDAALVPAVLVTSISPVEPLLGSEVMLRGIGFTPTGNIVDLGQVELRDLVSADGGTLIQFSLPTEVPSRSEVPPKQLSPGEYIVVVSNSRGTSNSLRFMVRD